MSHDTGTHIPAAQTGAPSRGHVALLAYYYLPDNTSGVQRARRMVKYLPEAGYRSTVITTSEPGHLDDDPTGIWTPDAGSSESAHRQASILRRLQPLMPYNDRLLWTPYAVDAAMRLHRRAPLSAIVSTSPPVATHFAAWRTKKRLGVPWVADFRDPVVGNPHRLRSHGRIYDRWLERVVVENADAIVLVTDVVADQWKRRYPDAAHKIHVIWNGFDPDEAMPAVTPVANGPRILTHAGFLYRERFPFKLIESMDRLAGSGRISKESAHLRLIGPVEDYDQMTGVPAVRRLSESGCLSLDGKQVPRGTAIRLTAESDYLLLIDIVNPDRSGYTVPAKIFEYILTGRPILSITDDGSPVDRILEKCGVPVVTIHHADSNESVDGKVMQLFGLDSTPVRPSAWFCETFDGRRQMGTMAAILDRVTAQRR